jgi:hypothetical protein
MTTSNSISENAISFYASGGHAHDGVTSSLIKTNSYSIYDFNPSFIGDNPERRRAQVNNYNSFRQLVVNTINSTVLEPAGIVLQDNIINSRNIISGSITATEIAANTITADNIAAGTITANNIAANTITANNIATGAITADELSANLVLVNNVIRSNNFDGTVAANGVITVQGTSGWAITSAGSAVFDSTAIRGTLTASAVSTPGVDIYANGTLSANSYTLYGNGAIATSSGNFSVDASGNLTATNANITGEINATSGSISGNLLVGGTITSTDISGVNISGSFITGATYIQVGDLAAGYVLLTTGGQITAKGSIFSFAEITSATEISSSNIVSAGGAVTTPYLIFSGTVTGAGSSVIRRSDGYLLIQSSKRELKTNIEDIDNSLQKINALRPRIFNWKLQDSDPDDYFHREIKPNHKTMGFVVEEVGEVSPEYLEYTVSGDNELDGHYWKPHDFIALAIQGIKDLSAKVTTLEQRIAQLEG